MGIIFITMTVPLEDDTTHSVFNFEACHNFLAGIAATYPETGKMGLVHSSVVWTDVQG
jgi:hypothetical protein